jgi:hypothetical protein
MREWIANGLIIVGALTAVAGAIRANFAYVRFFRTRGAAPPQGRAIAGMEVAYSGSVAAVITGVGITVLVLGLVIGSGVQAWTLLLPISLAVGGALTAALTRRILEQLRNPA